MRFESQILVFVFASPGVDGIFKTHQVDKGFAFIAFTVQKYKNIFSQYIVRQILLLQRPIFVHFQPKPVHVTCDLQRTNQSASVLLKQQQQQQQEGGCGSSTLHQVAHHGERLQDPGGLLSAKSPRLPCPVLGPAVPEVSRCAGP